MTDSLGNTIANTVNMTVASGTPNTINFGQNAALGTVQQGFQSNFNLSPSGGTAPYSATAVTPLPPGFALLCGNSLLSGFTPGSTCTLTGMPLATGPFTFTVRIDDSVGNLGARTFTLGVSGVSAFTNAALPDASTSSRAARGVDNPRRHLVGRCDSRCRPVCRSSSGVLSGTRRRPGSIPSP